MFDSKELSRAIREKKKKSLRPDMDSAGQTGIDPNEAWDDKQNEDVNEALDESDAMPASPHEMGEDESSQEIAQLKKSMARINKYFESL